MNELLTGHFEVGWVKEVRKKILLALLALAFSFALIPFSLAYAADAEPPLFIDFYSHEEYGSSVFFYRYHGDAADLALWRSDDLGATWQQYWRGADGFLAGDNLTVVASESDLTLLFANAESELAGEVLLVFEVLSLGVNSSVVYANVSGSDVRMSETGAEQFLSLLEAQASGSALDITQLENTETPLAGQPLFTAMPKPTPEAPFWPLAVLLAFTIAAGISLFGYALVRER